MTKKDLLAEGARRTDALHNWYRGALAHFEGRDAPAVTGAMKHLINDWGPDEEWLEVAHQIWQEVEHELSMTTIKSAPEEGLELAVDLLGRADPAWELWEVPLIVGLLLVEAAVRGFRSASGDRHIQAGLLLSDAIEAQNAWISHRGLVGCRRPDKHLVRFDEAVNDEIMQLGRKELARSGAVERHSKGNAARQWVIAEWREHRVAYANNKSAFARDYARRVLNERGVDVKEKTIREIWLRDTPSASSPAH